MKEIVVATKNSGKFREIELSLRDMPLLLRSLKQFPHLNPVLEDGQTFVDNALKKARFVAAELGKCALADDSGLEVLALDGRPGIHSSRFAGPNATDEENNRLLLKELYGTPLSERQARFICVMALVTDDGRELIVDGECDGEILTEPRGLGGFGYDPLFFIPSIGKTFAELVPNKKASISHRGQCLQMLRKKLPDFLGL